MKKWIGLCLCTMFPLFAHAHNVEVQISGKIKDSTCSIVQNDKDKSVTLGDYRLQDLTSTGFATSFTEFTIGLEGCGPDTKEVNVAFTGTSAAGNPELLALESGSVSQLGIRILDKNKNAIALNNTQDGGVLYSLQPGQSDDSLLFYAQYVVLATPVSAGPANGTANLVLTWP